MSEPELSASPVPTEPLANKAVVAAAGTIVTVLLRWAVSGHFSLSDEGLVALAGAITTVAVYAVSNFRRLVGIRDERGLTSVELLLILILACLVIALVVGWNLG